MTPLEHYKEILRQLDQLSRDNKDDSPEYEALCDQGEEYWDKLNEDEIKEVRNYSAFLFTQWTPLENYKNACRILDNFPQPHHNDKTTPEARKIQKDYWIKERDTSFAKLTEKEKNHYDK